MSNWIEAPLEQLVTLQRGFDIAKREFQDGPFPVISSSGVIGTHDTAKANGPGVLVGRKGTLGTVHYCPSPYFPHSTSLWSRDFHGNHPRFVYYFLKTLHLERFDVGAANPTLNRNHIHGLPIRIPPHRTQEKIAGILAFHDELIENNLRRIKIFEEMAQAIYREWFIKFRFPGRGSAALVDSPFGPVPEDWAIAPLSAVADARRGLSWDRQQETNGPLQQGVLTIPNMQQRLNPAPRTRLRDVSEKDVVKFSVLANDILMIGSNGNPERVGQTVLVTRNLDSLFASFLMRIRASSGQLNPVLLFHQLQDGRVTQQLRASAIGATGLRNIRITVLRDVELLIPPPAVQQRFADIVQPMVHLADRLGQQNHILQSTRDLLLPKLISGQIDVSELDIETSWLAA